MSCLASRFLASTSFQGRATATGGSSALPLGVGEGSGTEGAALADRTATAAKVIRDLRVTILKTECLRVDGLRVEEKRQV